MTPVRYATSTDGTRIAYRMSGSGDPIVFVHGSSTSSADWVFVLPLLRDRFTVVTLDRRGRALSGDGLEYAMEREAEDVLAVLDAVVGGLLVGHSYGALCSILAAEGTERLRGLVLYEPPIAVGEDRLGALNELVARGELDGPSKAFCGRLAYGTTNSRRSASRRHGRSSSTPRRHCRGSCAPPPSGGARQGRSKCLRSSCWARKPTAPSTSTGSTSSRRPFQVRAAN